MKLQLDAFSFLVYTKLRKIRAQAQPAAPLENKESAPEEGTWRLEKEYILDAYMHHTENCAENRAADTGSGRFCLTEYR